MSATEVVVDASVIVKWFVEEEHSDKALSLRDSYVAGELRIAAPELMPFEVLNALYYKGLFSESDLKEISEALEAYSFELYPLRGEYMQKTVEVAFKNDITIYDASYVALALAKKTLFYTADEKLLGKVANLNLAKHIRDFVL